ncbi:MAG: hypothetical protein KA184_10545 [Candidatus Hydrogenedentes bacterium]|nr:hypothetical protein [Candidatus Hydrogenedentota bacterium]
MRKPAVVFWCCLLAASWTMTGAIAAQEGELLFPNSDFEQGNLNHWKQEGNAFQDQPTRGDNPRARDRSRSALPQGSFWVGTYELFQGKRGQKPGQMQGDKPQGGLLSEPFTIRKPYISFLVAGGMAPAASVDLVVSGSVVRSASGAESPTLRQAVWDVTEFLGERALIYVRDRSSAPWGIISVDDFRALDRAPDLLPFPNSDFELGTLDNWTADGPAFQGQPARHGQEFSANPYEPNGVFHVDVCAAPPAETPAASAAQTLTSLLFEVRGRALGFRFRASADAAVRLLIDGRPVQSAAGAGEENVLSAVWMLDEYKGRFAQIQLALPQGGPQPCLATGGFYYVRRY